MIPRGWREKLEEWEEPRHGRGGMLLSLVSTERHYCRKARHRMPHLARLLDSQWPRRRSLRSKLPIGTGRASISFADSRTPW